MKECEILGYKVYDEKDENKKLTGRQMIRIIICVNPKKEGFFGKAPVIAFLPYEENLIEDLNKYINESDNHSAYYETTDDILTGKTKIKNIVVE